MNIIYKFCNKYICSCNISKIHVTNYEDNPYSNLYQNLDKVNKDSDISDISDISDLESIETVDN